MKQSEVYARYKDKLAMLDDPLVKKVEATIQKFNMLPQGSKVVVGISGGPDSTVLLHLLYSLKEKYKIEIWAAYLDHCIREDRTEEKEWVKQLVRELQVPLISDSIDVPLLAKEKGLSLEFAARQARYNFLEHVANKVGAARIAVGHTASDQAETVLMRLIRGSGIDGLAGIPFVRGRIIRPLLKIFRWEIEEYCKRYSLTPAEDPSNKNLSILRNSVRFKLIPFLSEHYNPRIVETLSNTADILQADKDFLEKATLKAQRKVVEKKTDRFAVINVKKLSNLHLSLQRRVIRHLIEELRGGLESIEYTHIHQILDLKKNRGTKVLDLPGNLRIRCEYDKLVIEKGEETPPSFFKPLRVPGKTELPELGMVFETEVVSERPSHFPSDPYQAHLDFDKITESLFLRPRQEGDKFKPLGMKGGKKLKNFFIDLKVPRFERDNVPILVSGDKIVWVVGHRIDDRFKVKEDTRRILKIKVTFYDTSGRGKKKNRGNRS